MSVKNKKIKNPFKLIGYTKCLLSHKIKNHFKLIGYPKGLLSYRHNKIKIRYLDQKS